MLILGAIYLIIGTIVLIVRYDKEEKPSEQAIVKDGTKLEDILMAPKIEDEEYHGVDHSHDTVEDTFPPEIALLTFVAAAKEDKDADYLSSLFNYEKVYQDTSEMEFEEIRNYISDTSQEVIKGVDTVEVISIKREETSRTASLKVSIHYHDGRSVKTTRVETVKIEKDVYVINQSLKEMKNIFQEEQ